MPIIIILFAISPCQSILREETFGIALGADIITEVPSGRFSIDVKVWVGSLAVNQAMLEETIFN